ncbi:MAG: hypothetical protein LBL07_15430 [Tannerella sp.]|nr:hypothetical protein [Tannerella sp.]
MKQNNRARCGGCILFEYESAGGEGVCVFHQTVLTCDTEACGDFTGKSPQEFLTDMYRIERILNRKNEHK